MSTIRLEGHLEVDTNRGVLYFHNNKNGCTTLRICGLKDLMPERFNETFQIDITHDEDRVQVTSFDGFARVSP